MRMVQLMLDAAALVRFAHAQGHRLERDEDSGYATHAWLAATFGKLAPQPFRLTERPGGLHLLGYSSHAHEALCAHADLYAEPLALAVCRWEAAASKSLPDQWAAGLRLGFEVRACPVSRGESERDVFLAALDRARVRGEALPERSNVYLAWLRAQLASVAVLEDAELAGFRRVALVRRSRPAGALRSLERPDALFRGRLTVAEPESFGRLLQRGLGRHRAFGFGMLLLRPARD